MGCWKPLYCLLGDVVELADTHDSKSSPLGECGFDPLRWQFSEKRIRKESAGDRPKFGLNRHYEEITENASLFSIGRGSCPIGHPEVKFSATEALLRRVCKSLATTSL
jgi:hypothetical protein